MQKELQDEKKFADELQSVSARYEERISKLEQSNYDLQLQLTSLKAAVEREMSSPSPKVSRMAEERVASESSSDEPASGTRQAAAPSTSTSETPSTSNPPATSITEAAAPSTSTSETPSTSNPPATSFTDAAAAGDAVALRRMFAGPNPNTRDSNGVPALHLAAGRGHVQALEVLLDRGAHVDSVGPGLRRALHVATAGGHVDVVRRLLKAGSMVEIKDREGNTPLKLAVKDKHWLIARLLVEEGADPNATVFEGKSALMVAAAEGESDTVAVMIRHNKPKPDNVAAALSFAKNVSVVWAFEEVLPGVIEEKGRTAMRMAAKEDRLNSMAALLDAGVHIDSKDENMLTALMWASRNGSVECVKELVQRGALLDVCHQYNGTALHIASSNGKKDVVRVLLDAGIDATKRTNYGQTALDFAATEEIRKILRNHAKQS